MSIKESIHFPFLIKTRCGSVSYTKELTTWVTDQRAEETYGLLLYRKTYL